MIFTSERIAWPVIFAVVFSTLTVLATDYAWRVINASIHTVWLLGVAVLFIGNAVILKLAAKSR